MNRVKGNITIDTERCKGCGLCVEACPKHVISLSKTEINRYGYFFAEAVAEAECIGCSSCGIMCPDACITVYRTPLRGN